MLKSVELRKSWQNGSNYKDWMYIVARCCNCRYALSVELLEDKCFLKMLRCSVALKISKEDW